MEKLYIDEKTGTAYWKQDREIVGAPINADNTVNIDCYGAIQEFISKEDEIRIRAALA